MRDSKILGHETATQRMERDLLHRKDDRAEREFWHRRDDRSERVYVDVTNTTEN